MALVVGLVAWLTGTGGAHAGPALWVSVALICGAIAVATAPVATMAVFRELGASGPPSPHFYTSYDNVGNRATILDSTGTITYSHNAGNRLTVITDPSNNRITNTGELSLQNSPGIAHGARRRSQSVIAAQERRTGQ